ncbi:unnamed protein product [Triticum turgidum subsp. durum]|uniref:Uncharacterized protein n=1 Tax=Triticum turgidum subsp. durum TaxID=4567 RepID=A0A9R1QCH8_TRITD|nr:unnamed protein product [Triticum turgidum subsp. durum]
MEEEFFMAVKRTEHVEVTSRSVAASAKGKEAFGGVEQPKMVRVFCDDFDATDSSSDEEEGERRRVKRYVQEIRLQPAVQPPAGSKNGSSSATSYDSCEESHVAAASPTSVLRSFPQSTLAAAVDDDASKKPSSSSSTTETDESSGVFGCSFSGDDFAGELAPLYTDFDLLSDFAEPPMDFLSNLPEPAFTFSSDCSLSAYNPCPPSPAALQQADEFFEDITDLFQIDPLPVI